jgi:Fic family protein
LSDWPDFHYDLASTQDVLFAIAEKTGLIQGKLACLKSDLKEEALIDLMINEAIASSEIEGEFISRQDVRSSIINALDLNKERLPIQDKRAEGLEKLMLDVRESFKKPLTKEKFFSLV